MKATESGIMQFLLLANFELKYLKSAYDNQKYEAMFLDIKKLADYSDVSPRLYIKHYAQFG